MRVSPEQEQINRQLLELGKAIRADDNDEALRLAFGLLADVLGELARIRAALETLAGKGE